MKWCRQHAREHGLDIGEVVKAVLCFFDDIVLTTRRLPFDNIRRIYTADAVADKACVYNIPYIGRLGPVYSQYLKWRSECAEEQEIVSRADVYAKHRAEKLDKAFDLVMSGKKIPEGYLRDPIPASLYHKVWIIDKDGRRRAAKQLFKKTNE